MGDSKPKSQSAVWSTVKPFVNGGASGMLATCVIQPIDMVKSAALDFIACATADGFVCREGKEDWGGPKSASQAKR